MQKPNRNKQEAGGERPQVPSVTLIRGQVKKFQQVEPRYKELAKVLEAILRKAEKQYAPLAIVQTRPKKVDSFAEKITRKWAGLKTDDPVTEFTDLCGGRIITLLKSHSDAVCQFIEDHFDIDRDNCVNAIERLNTTEFGYLSRHFIVSLKPGEFTAEELGLAQISDKVYPSEGCPMKAEIQVRTILEHAFADVTHDLCYKSSFKVPDKWLRQVAAVAASLETTSNEMEAIVAGVQDYAANYGGTLTPKQTRQEIQKLEPILEFDPEHVKTACRIARLAITMGDWNRALRVLKPFLKKDEPAVWRDYGVALVKKHLNNCHESEYKQKQYERGQRFLKKAAAPQYGDSDAMAAYASSWRPFVAEDVEAAERVRTWYHEAYKTDPNNAYAMANVLELEIVQRGDLSAVALMRPAIERAIQRGLGQAEVGTNHPWAYYNAALFSALIEKEYEGLGYLAKAIACSNAPFMLESACRSATRIETAVSDRVILGLFRRLLSAGSAAKSFQKDWNADAECTPLSPTKPNPFKNHSGQIVIVVGDCSNGTYGNVDNYRDKLLHAFTDYRGIIVSGGTKAGVAGVVGDIAEATHSTCAIGYVPAKVKKELLDARYSKCIHTTGKEFSAEEPIQYWQDILAAGIDPAEVCVIGVGGGEIAAVEYRIALAMGAKVAVFESSGRAVQKLLEDIHWRNDKNLIPIPEDRYTLQYLVQPKADRLPERLREALAEAIHEDYREKQKYTISPKDRAMHPWSTLEHDLKDSNGGQADDMGVKLSAIGCKICEVQGRAPASTSFSEEEVGMMSQMEHGRWNAEKLRNGWRYGKVKDAGRKTNPCLVPWDHLPDSEKQKDINAIKDMPRVLEENGFEIQRFK